MLSSGGLVGGPPYGVRDSKSLAIFQELLDLEFMRFGLNGKLVAFASCRLFYALNNTRYAHDSYDAQLTRG